MAIFRASVSGRRNSRRAVFGSILVIGGFVAGGWIGVGRLHRSMVKDRSPVRMNCGELLRNGVGENCIVRLTDAVVREPAAVTAESADNAEPQNAMLTRVRTVMAHPKAQPLVDQIVRGHVAPAGARVTSGPQPLQLGMGRVLAATAKREAESTGELLVHASPDPTSRWIVAASQRLGITLPASWDRAASMPSYTLHPVSAIDAPPVAAAWVVGGMISMAIGLVLCGAAGWGRWVILCPTGAILGLPGIPLRNGRGSQRTRGLYILVGAALLGGGVFLSVEKGGLLSGAPTWWLQLAGFTVMSVGLASVLGVLVHARGRHSAPRSEELLHAVASNESPKRGKKRNGRKAARAPQPAAALAAPPVGLAAILLANSDFTRRFLDDRLSVCSRVTPDAAIQSQTDSLLKLNFEEPLLIEIARSAGACQGTIQVGCENVVLAMTDQLDDVVRLRMISVFENGHVVISVNDLDPTLPKSMAHEVATLNVTATRHLTELLSAHLEFTATAGERRHGQLVGLESAEWRDVLLYSERCLADMMHHCGVQKWEIPDAQYGRFHYPPQSVLAGTAAVAGN